MLAKRRPLGQVPSSTPSPQPAPHRAGLEAHGLVRSEASSCLMETRFGARAAKLLLVARTLPLSLVSNHGYLGLNSSENSAGCSVLGDLYFGLPVDSLLPRRNDQRSKHHRELHFDLLNGRGGREILGRHRQTCQLLTAPGLSGLDSESQELGLIWQSTGEVKMSQTSSQLRRAK